MWLMKPISWYLPGPSLMLGPTVAASIPISMGVESSSSARLKIQSIALSTLLSVALSALTAWSCENPMDMTMESAAGSGLKEVSLLAALGGMKGSPKSGSSMCSMTQAVAASMPEFSVK
uniref:Uncharacterized protein n=1 Tax=Ixodes ricinus TaxID=34613 RepID=A0A6B0UN84_IXORI